MSSTVRFECATCGWRHDVAKEHVVLVHGLPQSVYVPYHQCEGGADVSERGSFEAEMLTTKPGYNLKIRL